MGFSIGLVGLPNAGKSTIFNALSRSRVQTGNYPFTTIEPNNAVVEIPDERLAKIAGIVKPPKVTHATLECIDIAGLVEGSSKGEGLGNKFLENIRGVDAVGHIVRCFLDENVPHEAGELNPEKDLSLIETELMLADLEVITKRYEKVSRALKVGTKEIKKEHDFLLNLKTWIEKGNAARDFEISSDEDGSIYKTLNLLTSKPSIYIANADEGTEDLLDKARAAALKRNGDLIVINGLVEAELIGMEEEERIELLKEYGFEESSLKRFLVSAYKSLKLIMFYTVKGDETKAWILKEGQNVIEAAAKIHSDIAEGFIKAEIARYDDFIKEGSFDGVKKSGKLLIAGRDTQVSDGDIVMFRFK